MDNKDDSLISVAQDIRIKHQSHWLPQPLVTGVVHPAGPRSIFQSFSCPVWPSEGFELANPGSNNNFSSCSSELQTYISSCLLDVFR